MLSQYELERERRMAENKAKIASLQVKQIRNDLEKTMLSALPRMRVAPRKDKPTRSATTLAEKRQSSRLQGTAPKNYNESVLDLVDSSPRAKGSKSRLPDRHVASTEERYTQEHVALLGNYEQPWELFVDGYENGVRVYDKVSGKTCHQCRQKTLGRHTSCSHCNSLQGVFCGDCLFMRYGENILEVEGRGDWVCPPCRSLCNCSFHRIRRGWAPTGSMYRRAIAEGYRSVAHYLVLTNLEEAPAAPHQEALPDAEPAALLEQVAEAVRGGKAAQGPARRRRPLLPTAAQAAATKTSAEAPRGTKRGRKTAQLPGSPAEAPSNAEGAAKKAKLGPGKENKGGSPSRRRAPRISQLFRQKAAAPPCTTKPPAAKLGSSGVLPPQAAPRRGLRLRTAPVTDF
eukprot:jgi/Botrbrau1/16462/Bobra.0142s0057.1